MAKRNVSLREIFLGLQSQMSSRLTLNRKILTHPVTKGDAAELEWIEMLNTYLPKRYQADKAFVIDHAGAVSEQIDIVIFDRHFSPFLLKQNGATYVPAESLYAVIEVKPQLSSSTIQYAAKKAESVRRLVRTNANIVHAAGEIRQPKSPFEILAGIVSLSGQVKGASERKLGTLNGARRIDFGCSLENGAFTVDRSPGVSKVTVSGAQEALIVFFLNLVADLQRLGSVPAIEIDKYVTKIKRP